MLGASMESASKSRIHGTANSKPVLTAVNSSIGTKVMKERDQPFAPNKIVQMKAAQKLIQRILSSPPPETVRCSSSESTAYDEGSWSFFMNEHSFQAETRNTQAARPAATEGSWASGAGEGVTMAPNRFFSDRYMLRTCA